MTKGNAAAQTTKTKRSGADLLATRVNRALKAIGLIAATVKLAPSEDQTTKITDALLSAVNSVQSALTSKKTKPAPFTL